MRSPSLSRRHLLASGAALALLGAARPGLAQEGGAPAPAGDAELASRIAAVAEPLPAITDPDFARFIDRYAGARVVLMGEETHGTDDFYRARAAMTERLVREHGFTVVAVEADWPDAARIDGHLRGHDPLASSDTPFPRFPAWMWRNRPVEDLIGRLRAFNEEVGDPARQASFHGLDLYSLPSSMDAVEEFAQRHDPAALEEIRARYGCLAPWADDPQTYGALARSSPHDTCAADVSSVATDVLGRRLGEVETADPRVFDAFMNARVVAASEAYYRAMYEGGAASWNLRDTHFFETLLHVLEARGDGAKAVVWAHNSHIGDARATGMSERGEINIGQLAREHFGEEAVLIGFGTDRGTVTAATEWNAPPQVMEVNPSLDGSWGALMREVGPERFFLDLRALDPELAEALSQGRIERFIGVLYLRETELWSHYVEAALGRQFDGYVWLEETQAVEWLTQEELEALPPTHPFAS